MTDECAINTLESWMTKKIIVNFFLKKVDVLAIASTKRVPQIDFGI